MGTLIRRVKPGDEGDLAYIQTESWKAAFADILDADGELLGVLDIDSPVLNRFSQEGQRGT